MGAALPGVCELALTRRGALAEVIASRAPWWTESDRFHVTGVPLVTQAARPATVVPMAESQRRPRTYNPLTAPPKVGAVDVQAILADIAARARVSLPELGARIGMDEQARAYAVREGLIETMPERGPRNSYMIPPEEARRLLLAAVLAIGAGVALTIMLRGVKGAGLSSPAVLAALEGAGAAAALSLAARRVVAT